MHAATIVKVRAAAEMLAANPARRSYQIESDLMRRFNGTSRRQAARILSRARGLLARESGFATKELADGLPLMLGDLYAQALMVGDLKAAARVAAEVRKFVEQWQRSRAGREEEAELREIRFTAVGADGVVCGLDFRADHGLPVEPRQHDDELEGRADDENSGQAAAEGTTDE